jgi:CheY-like chemotaxis protein
MSAADLRPEILLVEDDESHVILTRECLNRAKVAVNLSVAADGADCMSFLRKQGAHANAPTPDLVLLDLNMPKMDGREVMSAIRNDDRLKTLAVVILTTSDNPADIDDLYRRGCNSYVVKPHDFNKFIETIDSLCRYWFNTVQKPAPHLEFSVKPGWAPIENSSAANRPATGSSG